ncbi:hypothetical protein JK628_08105 [Shewanella sp. KX20019]|uniref:hypothetical protein n=1 Tax=Shewanella sp. KX20019 TaxID=2803864 RepID=UPI001925586F|nr:hypothetical protein [Shewanella sp. KX20019]QQX81784.1 hypothetical protein JK628_08105 [Shewanella sp. KX20019]
MASHMQQLAGKTDIKGAVNTVSLLLIFLLSIAAFTLGSLYFELKYKHQLLVEEVAELKGSQILFMVPDEQAEVMANWMAENPVFVQSFAERARKGEITTMPVGDGSVEQDIVKQAVQTVTADANSEQAGDNQKVATDLASSIETAAASVPVSKVPATKALATIELTGDALNESATPVNAAVTMNSKPSAPASNEESNEATSAVLDAAAVATPVKAQMLSVAANEVNNETATVVLDAAAVAIPVKAQMLTVSEDGVKLISLPHGGIRITTRTLEE